MPTLTVTPPAGRGGTRFRVTGDGLEPGTRYRLVVVAPTGQEVADDAVSADAGGRFASDVVAEAGDAPGRYLAQLRARDAVVAVAAFTVTER